MVIKETSEQDIGIPDIEPLIPDEIKPKAKTPDKIDNFLEGFSDRELELRHLRLHYIYKQLKAGVRVDDWTEVDVIQNHILLVREFARRMLAHVDVDGLDKASREYPDMKAIDELATFYADLKARALAPVRTPFGTLRLEDLSLKGKYSVQAHEKGNSIHYDISLDTGLKSGFEKWAVIKNPVRMKEGEATLVVKRSICKDPRWFYFSGVIKPNDPREWLRGGNSSKTKNAYVKVIDRGKFERIDDTSTLKGQIMTSSKGGLKGRYIFQSGPEGRWLFRKTKISSEKADRGETKL